jgi:WD40 repeat protein
MKKSFLPLCVIWLVGLGALLAACGTGISTPQDPVATVVAGTLTAAAWTPTASQTNTALPTATRKAPPTRTVTPRPLAGVDRPLPEFLPAIEPENAAKVQEIGRWGRGSLSQAVFSPDGRWLLLQSTAGLTIYEAGKNTPVQSFEGGQLLGFSGDGKQAAINRSGLKTAMYEVSSWSRISELDGQADQLSPDWQYALEQTNLGEYSLRQINSWKEAAHFKTRLLRFVPGSARFALLTSQGIEMWEPGAKTPLYQISLAQGEFLPNQLAFSQDGNFLAVSGAATPKGEKPYPAAMFYRASDGTLAQNITRFAAFSMDLMQQAQVDPARPNELLLSSILTGGTPRAMTALCAETTCALDGPAVFSPDGQRLMAAVKDGRLVMWDAASGQSLFSIAHGERVHLYAFSPDGQMIISQALDGIVKLTRASDGGQINEYYGFSSAGLGSNAGQLKQLFFNGSEPLFVQRSAGTLVVTGAKSEVPLSVIRPHTQLYETFSLNPVAISPEKDLLAVSGSNHFVWLYRLSNGEYVNRQENFELGSRLAFAPGGGMLASSGPDSEYGVFFLYTPSLELIRQIPNLAFLPTPLPVASTATPRPDGLEPTPLPCAYCKCCNALAFTPDGSRLAAGGDGQTVFVLRTNDGALLAEIHTGVTIGKLAFSPDGNLLAVLPKLPQPGATVANPKYIVQIWNMFDNKLLREFNLVTQPMLDQLGVNSLPGDSQTLTACPVFSPDGKFLAAGLGVVGYSQGHWVENGSLQLWQVVDGKLAANLNTRPLASISFSSGGELLGGVTYDGVAQIWGALP